MPLFDKKDKSRYATFTRRTIGMDLQILFLKRKNKGKLPVIKQIWFQS